MSTIKTQVIGVGGYGDFVLSNLDLSAIANVSEVISVNTDAQIQETLPVSVKRINISETGKGTGANPDTAYSFAQARREQLIEMLRGTDIVFFVAGLGKGTGTGATTYLTELTKELGIYSVVVLRTPEQADGNSRINLANEYKARIVKNADAYIDINNDTVLEHAIAQGVEDIEKAYSLGNQSVFDAVRGLVSIVNNVGSRNVDLEDFKATVRGSFGIKTATHDAFSTDLNIYALNSQEARTALSVTELPVQSSDSLKKTMAIRKAINESLNPECSQITGILNNPNIEDVSVIYIVSGFEKTLSEIRREAGMKGLQNRYAIANSSKIETAEIVA